MICDRCGERTGVFAGSYFNTELVCMSCIEAERAHPAFEEARRVENEAVRRGDYNFPGVGLPAELEVRDR